jgi:hypothetical protein
MMKIVCSKRTVTALRILSEILSVRLGDHELVDFSIDVDTDTDTSSVSLFVIGGHVLVSLTKKVVKFSSCFYLGRTDINEDSILIVDDERYRASWSPEDKRWSLVTYTYRAGNWVEGGVKYSGTRNVHGEEFESFCPEI